MYFTCISNVTSIYKESFTGIPYESLVVEEGDTVGIGFNVTDVKFNDSGTPQIEQTLTILFIKNGQEVSIYELFVVLSENVLKLNQRALLCNAL